jgi:hypothetical protein
VDRVRDREKDRAIRTGSVVRKEIDRLEIQG